MEKITSTLVQEFLSDYAATSETQILEEGKEQNDILAVAEKRGYNLKNRKSLAGFKTIYTFAEKANKNKARLPKDKLLKVLPEIIGTPIDVDHNRDCVVGHYIDYRYVASNETVIAYGVFYKSNFADKWVEAEKLFKDGKLCTSYEIWCPKNKRKYLPDGTYELTQMEIAGGALIFKEKPAFADALVLETAKVRTEILEEDLVVASEKKYDNEDLIISSVAIVEAPVIANPNQEGIITKTELQVQHVVPIVPVIPKIKCQNCQTEFDNTGFILQSSEKSCPNCKAIVGEQGEVKYPPQVMDFTVSCPSCRNNNWLIKANSEESADVKCKGCNKDYKINFKKDEPNPLKDKIKYLFKSAANCPQCSTYVPFSTTTVVKSIMLKCPHCEMSFVSDITKANSKKQIKSIEEPADLNKASAEGEVIVMENKDNVQPEEVLPMVEPVVNVEVAPDTSVVVTEPVVIVESEFEVDDADEIESTEVPLEVAMVMTTDQRNALPDSTFAVVKTVKNKKTGENRKIRMYPLNDENHVKSALSYINHSDSSKSLNKLGLTVEEVRKKIEDKAKSMGMNVADIQSNLSMTPEEDLIVEINSLISKNKGTPNENKVIGDKLSSLLTMIQNNPDEMQQMEMDMVKVKSKNSKLKKLFKAACAAKRKLSKESILHKASVDELEVAKAKIELLEANAVKVVERKNTLGEFGKDLSEKDILDDDKFEFAKVKKENAELKSNLNTASEHVTVRSNTPADIDKMAKNIAEIRKNKLKY
jgi:hypothetical protein